MMGHSMYVSCREGLRARGLSKKLTDMCSSPVQPSGQSMSQFVRV
jgi:hypothetical protein